MPQCSGFDNKMLWFIVIKASANSGKSLRAYSLSSKASTVLYCSYTASSVDFPAWNPLAWVYYIILF